MVENKQQKQDELVKDIIDLIERKGWTSHCDDEDISNITQIHVTEDKDYTNTIINIEFF